MAGVLRTVRAVLAVTGWAERSGAQPMQLKASARCSGRPLAGAQRGWELSGGMRRNEVLKWLSHGGLQARGRARELCKEARACSGVMLTMIPAGQRRQEELPELVHSESEVLVMNSGAVSIWG